jgi:hypothetical protein
MIDKNKASMMTNGEKWLREEAIVDGVYDENLYRLLEAKEALGAERITEGYEEGIVAQIGIVSAAIRKRYAELGAPLPEPIDLTHDTGQTGSTFPEKTV